MKTGPNQGKTILKWAVNPEVKGYLYGYLAQNKNVGADS